MVTDYSNQLLFKTKTKTKTSETGLETVSRRDLVSRPNITEQSSGRIAPSPATL